MMARDYNQKMTARASAVLTTGEVAATAMDIAVTDQSQLCVRADFTVGLLTNVIIRCYVSEDGTTYDLLYGEGGAAYIVTLTATDTVAMPIPNLSGYKFFRVTAQGTGTVTNSLLALTYKWNKRGCNI
jgi:hypothetical protein